LPPAVAFAPPLAIIVMGVSGCGKTTLATLLAEALDCSFLEGDLFHSPEAVAKMRSGQPLDDDDRWPWLDRLGAAAVRSIAEHNVAVLACSALRLRYRDRLRATIGHRTRFILLDAGREQLLARLANRAGHFMPASLLDSQLATLERPRAGEDAIALAAHLAPEALCDLALDRLQFSPQRTC